MVEPTDLLLRRVRNAEIKLDQTVQRLSETLDRLYLLERDMASLVDHRVRHEARIAEIHDRLDKIQRRLEISDE